MLAVRDMQEVQRIIDPTTFKEGSELMRSLFPTIPDDLLSARVRVVNMNATRAAVVSIPAMVNRIPVVEDDASDCESVRLKSGVTPGYLVHLRDAAARATLGYFVASIALFLSVLDLILFFASRGYLRPVLHPVLDLVFIVSLGAICIVAIVSLCYIYKYSRQVVRVA